MRAAILIAQLSASLPPEVTYTSSSRQFRHRAMVRRASVIAPRAACPKLYREDGLPYCSVRYGIMLSSTSGSSRVVAALSAYTNRSMSTPASLFNRGYGGVFRSGIIPSIIYTILVYIAIYQSHHISGKERGKLWIESNFGGLAGYRAYFWLSITAI